MITNLPLNTITRLDVIDADGNRDELIGTVLSTNVDRTVIKLIEGGIASLPTKEIFNWKSVKSPKVETPPSAKNTARKVVSPKAGGENSTMTKREQVKQIMLDNSCKSRKEIINIIVQQVGMTLAGAATYYANAKNDLSRGESN